MSFKTLAVLVLAVSQVAFGQVSKLATTDSLEKVVQHFNQEWTDNNITTGTTRIQAGQWKTPTSNLEKTMATMLVAEVKKDSGNKGQLSKVKTTSKLFTQADVLALVKAYAEGNDF